MKHINSNFSPVHFSVPYTLDKEFDTRAIDQFPVSDSSLYKRDGWPMSDIGILDRFSRDSNIDKSEIDMIARRLEFIQSEPANKKSDAQLLRELRPAWVQTASEVLDFENAVYDIISKQKNENIRKTETQNVTSQVKDVETSGVLEDPAS